MTMALTSLAATPRAWARKVRYLAESSTPAIPITRFRGKPETLNAVYTMASIGFVTTISTHSGEYLTTSRVHDFTIATFLESKSFLPIPGFRARPATMITTSESAVSLKSFDPTRETENPSIGPDCIRSSALPCGTPSTTSIIATSAIPRFTAQCAAEAPTFPAPIIESFFLVIINTSYKFC